MLAYDAPQNLSELLVFRALEVDDGPIARARLPLRIPAGFHGKWKYNGAGVLAPLPATWSSGS